MAIQDNTIVGLRTQILENWRYLHPHDTSKLLIVISLKNQLYQALIAQDCPPPRTAYMISSCCYHVEEALRELLDWTSEKIGSTLTRDQLGYIIR
ncbi:hypothetical protein KCV07_g5224, partial [Aureobasidium melanogenum]